ncbi:hypothetical protein [Microvirga rosea]|uniref:hypothetical protein n=1 Tax=Microvirga rosea TaxID=2715425 RepID=UPI001D0A7B2F|nr:hypothetical protein [Microvirga rosea]MCB8819939.1 hypothetical protein [Microvirga rosea]
MTLQNPNFAGLAAPFGQVDVPFCQAERWPLWKSVGIDGTISVAIPAAWREAMQFTSILSLGAISLALAACQTQQQANQNKENLLAAAGFTLQPANSPARIAAMKKLPPNRFVRQTSGGTVVYVYADPAGCQCVYFGDQTAWSSYRAAVFAKQLADEQQMTAMMNQNAFDFGPWGPGFW